MGQRLDHLFLHNKGLLDRLTYILAFFQTGPGRLSVQQMDTKYMRCAGTVPKCERDALVAAASESGANSFVELWGVLGMQRERDVADEAAVLAHVDQFLTYVQAHEATWKAAPAPPVSSEGPALPPTALEQLSA